MKNTLCFFLILIFSSFAFADEVKEPNVAGGFYPAFGPLLKNKVDKFIDDAKIEPIEGEIIALISPHAGYDYSGWVAGYGYRAIQNKKYDTVILLGPSHFNRFNGVSVYTIGKFRTPLGDITVDTDLANEIIAVNTEKITFNPAPFEREHCLEVQLPFLQRSLRDFKIVPILFGSDDSRLCTAVSVAIVKAVNAAPNKKILIIASSDMSHYHGYKQACVMDNKALDIIKKFDPDSLYTVILTGSIELCGGAPVVTAMLAARTLGADTIKVLKYANSGDVTNERTRVVGYSSAIMIKSDKAKQNAIKKGEGKKMLNDAQRKRLLEIARGSIKEYLFNNKKLKITENDAVLNTKKGAFVTLTINNELRGCIGHIVADIPLYQTISEMALAAAVSDPRFPALTKQELDKIHIEISVMSELEKITDPNKVIVGTHGILIRKGFYSGLLLPQVATEYNWTRQEFLEHTCNKAGLDINAWKSGAEIFIFSAEVFGEK